MAITDNIIFRIKAQSGQSIPSSVVGAGETLTGGTAALVDLGGGVFAWKFTGAESMVTIPSKVVSTSADAGGVTLALTLKRVAYPTVSSQIMVGWTNAANSAGMLVRRGSAVPEDINCRALFSSQSSATKPAVPAGTLQTYVMRLETKAASLQDVTKLWVQTTGRVGTAADFTAVADNLTAQTIDTIRVNPTNGGDYEIVDLVLWGRELTDAEAAVVADNLRGTIDSASPITATSAISLDAVASTATGTVSAVGSISGSSAITLDAVTSSAAIASLISASSAITLGTVGSTAAASSLASVSLTHPVDHVLVNNTRSIFALTEVKLSFQREDTDAFVVAKTLTTDAAGLCGVVSDAALVAGVTYDIKFTVVATGAKGLFTATAI